MSDTDLNALAERLDEISVDLEERTSGDIFRDAADLRQAAQALRVLRRIGMMTVYHEGGNAMTLGDAPAIARSALE